MKNKNYINKKVFFKTILLQLLKDKQEKKEILKNTQDYINTNTIKNNILQIKKLVYILKYDGFTIIDNPIENIKKFCFFYMMNNLLDEGVGINIDN